MNVFNNDDIKIINHMLLFYNDNKDRIILLENNIKKEREDIIENFYKTHEGLGVYLEHIDYLFKDHIYNVNIFIKNILEDDNLYNNIVDILYKSQKEFLSDFIKFYKNNYL